MHHIASFYSSVEKPQSKSSFHIISLHVLMKVHKLIGHYGKLSDLVKFINMGVKTGAYTPIMHVQL